MARRPKRPCNHPGCKELVDGRYCVEHQKQHSKERNRYRKVSEHQKLYDYRWQQARAVFLLDHPLCIECKKSGKVEPATEVDHVVPHRGDRVLFWDSSNWQALCKTLVATVDESGSSRLLAKRRWERLHWG